MHSLEDYIRPLAPRARAEILLQRVSKIPAERPRFVVRSSRLTKGYLRRCVLNWMYCATMLGLSKH